MEQEHERLAPRCDEHPAERRSEKARAVEGERVQRDRVRQVVASDEILEERLPDRDLERARGPAQKADRGDLPHAHVAAEGERSEREREHHPDRLGREERVTAREPVGSDSRRQGEEQHREVGEEGDEAELERRVGQPQHEPALGDRLHPPTAQDDELPGPQPAEVDVTQRPERAGRERQDAARQRDRHPSSMGVRPDPARGA
jgi:hypothetical protein